MPSPIAILNPSQLHARHLARDGFHVFPVVHQDNVKKPAHRGWQDEATCDLDQVNTLFPTLPRPGNCYSVGLIPQKSGHVVIDLDIKHGHRGIENFAALEETNGEWSAAGLDRPPTVITASGGQHRYYRGDVPRDRIGKLGDGIDVKCKGLVIAPGSAGYHMAPGSAPLTNAPPLPDWLDALCRAGTDTEPRRAAPDVDLDDPHRIARATEIAGLAAPGVEYEGSDAATIALANQLLDWVSEEHATDILITEWMPRCVGDWDADYIEQKVINAAASRENDIGCEEFPDPAGTFGQATIRPRACETRLAHRPEVVLSMIRTMDYEGERDPELDQRIAAFKAKIEPGMQGHGAMLKTLEQLIDQLNNVDCTSAEFWEFAEFPPVNPILGGLVNSTSRLFLVAATGLGKTHFCMAIGGAIAAGRDFLYWHVPQALRVLYVDGEMPRGLMQRRYRDMVARMGLSEAERVTFKANFSILNREVAEDMPALNTPEGQAFIERWIVAHGGVDLIIFDNIQSLLIGEHTAEAWLPVKEWVRRLSQRQIAQIWVHHANDQGRTFGDKTRQWEMSTVMLMQKPEGEDDETIRFNVAFEKAREREDDNRPDFRQAQIYLQGGLWRYADTAGKVGLAAEYRSLIHRTMVERSMVKPVGDVDMAELLTGRPKDDLETEQMRQRLHDLHKDAKGKANMAAVGRTINGRWCWQLPEFWSQVAGSN